MRLMKEKIMNKCDYCDSPLIFMGGKYYACKNCGEYKQSANVQLEKEIQFQANEKLLCKYSWYYTRKYDMELADVSNQAYLIFCEAVERFDGRARFITFLSWRLKTLSDYCQKERSMMTCELSGDRATVVNTLEKIIFYELVEELSLDGQRVMKGILQGDFHRPEMKRGRVIGKHRIKGVAIQYWGWSHSRVDVVWDELKGWWDKNRLALVG